MLLRFDLLEEPWLQRCNNSSEAFLLQIEIQNETAYNYGIEKNNVILFDFYTKEK